MGQKVKYNKDNIQWHSVNYEEQSREKALMN